MADEKQEFESGLREVLSHLDFSLAPDQVDALYGQYSLLRQWNQRINLTAVREQHEVLWRHFGESLAVAKAIGVGEGAVVDVGSGAGFPGFPIAVSWSGRPVILVESVGKKAVFLKELGRKQPNVTVYGGRFEDFDQQAEWIVVRGLALDEVSVRFPRIARKAALLLSASQVASAKGRFDPEGFRDTILPWNPGTHVLSGSISWGGST